MTKNIVLRSKGSSSPWHFYPFKLPDLAEPLQQRTISQPRREIAEAFS